MQLPNKLKLKPKFSQCLQSYYKATEFPRESLPIADFWAALFC
jgi:hypothetical protein